MVGESYVGPMLGDGQGVYTPTQHALCVDRPRQNNNQHCSSSSQWSNVHTNGKDCQEGGQLHICYKRVTVISARVSV